MSFRSMVLALTSLAVASLPAQDFDDDFERGNGPLDGWTVHDGDWNIVDGVLVAGPAGATEQHAYVGDPALRLPAGDYVFSVDLQFLIDDQQPVGRHAGIAFCMDQPGARSSSSGYLAWWIDRTADRGINLTRRDGGGFTHLVQGGGDPLSSPPTNLTVEITGDTILVHADDVLVIEHVDNTYRGGHFGLWSWNGASQHVAFDNVTLEAEVPALTACFTFDPATPLPGNDVIFDASCSIASLGEIVGHEWSFGDGDSAEGEVVEHVYDFADNYVVTLTVEDDLGNVASVDRNVGVPDTLLPLEDDFNRAEGLADGWTIHEGDWRINADGQLQVTTQGAEATIWAGDPAGVLAGDFTIEFAMEFLATPNDGIGRHAGVFFCAAEPGSRWTTPLYDVWWIDRNVDFGVQAHIWNGPGGVLVPLGPNTGRTVPDLRDPPQLWTVTVDATTIRYYGDGVLLGEIDDVSFPREGHFGFWAHLNGQDVVFDDVSVREGVHLPEIDELLPCANASDTVTVAGTVITFDASCTRVPDGDSVTAWRWDFGDGQSEEGQVVEHVYEVADTYVAELTIEHTGGPDAIVAIEISINEQADLPFFDDFEMAAGPEVPGWTVFQGDWSISDDSRLEVVANGGSSPSAEAFIWAGSPPLYVTGDVTIEFEIEFLTHNPPTDGVGKHAGVFFFAEEPTTRHQTNCYDVWWIDRSQDQGLGLHRWIPLTFLSPGTGIELPELDLVDPPRFWRIEVDGPTIRVWGDDELLIERQDSTRREGYVGFWAYGNNQHVRFDNICVVEGPSDGSPECSDGASMPRACFTATPDAVEIDEDVLFDASCSRVPDEVTVTAYRWDFDDGETEEGDVIEHAFDEAGFFDVTLTIEHDAGDPVTSTRTVTVTEVAVLPVFETFDGPADEVPGWSASSGDWTINEDGQLEVVTSAQGGEAHIWLGSPPVLLEGDMTIEFEIEFVNHDPPLDPVGRHAGVFFYSEQPTLRWSSSSYDVWWIDRAQDLGMSLHKWPLEFLTPGSFDLFPEPPRRWRIEILGETIRVFGDDELVADVVDETRRSGYFGFWAYLNDQQVRFDNVCIVEGPFEGSPECEIVDPPGDLFVRGDSNASGTIDLTDGVVTLNFLFTGGEEPACPDAADTDDNGALVISDAVITFSYLFTGGAAPVRPSPTETNFPVEDCGVDPTDDTLGCGEFATCR